MKRKYFVLILLLLCSCASVAQRSGYIDIKNKSTEPYIFKFSGTQTQFNRAIKRFLLENGFSIASEDTSAGVLITDPKILKEDETYNTGAMRIASSMFGDSIDEEKGIVSIMYDTMPGGEIWMKLKCLNQAKSTTNSPMFGKIKDSSEKILAQGDPLPMKMKILLLKDTRFSLVP